MVMNLTKLEHECRALGHILGDRINEDFGPGKVGFCFMLFDFGGGGNLTYISNASRMDMIKALEEFKQKLETSVT